MRWGSPRPGEDQRIFTDADVEALGMVAQLQEIGGIDDDTMRAMTRMIGQSFARLASWQGQMTLDLIAQRPEIAGPDGSGVLPLLDRLTPLTEQLHGYVWRRQLNAYFARVASNLSNGNGPGAERAMAVGFADMAGFTTFTRSASDSELRAVLGAFEQLTTDVVGAHDGQVVKMIGDEVLFVTDDPHDAALTALELLEAADADDMLPDLRAGVAFGAVVSRLGDVYGQTVNIASRLTTVARPGSVLVDENLAGRLEGSADVVLHSMRPVAVRGYKHLRPARLRRAEA